PQKSGGNSLTLNIAGDFVMDVPTLSGRGQIVGDVSLATQIGATIDVHATGDVILHGNGTTGARISSNQKAGSCSGGAGGNITLATGGGTATLEAGSAVTSIAACNGGEITIGGDVCTVEIDGLVQSESTTPIGRGGPITVNAGATLTVGDSGKIISRGKDHGADLVHLQAGSDVEIFGLVASTGPGHAPVTNHCTKPGKPAGPHACVEVWS